MDKPKSPPKPSSVIRVCLYIPVNFIALLRLAYPECKSNAEAVVKYIMETASGYIEHRDFPVELKTVAISYLVSRYPAEYEQYLERTVVIVHGERGRASHQ